MATHELQSSPDTCHWGYFDSQLKPSLRIKSGDIATIHCVSGSNEILPQPRPFMVNAAAFSRCPCQHRDQQDSG